MQCSLVGWVPKFWRNISSLFSRQKCPEDVIWSFKTLAIIYKTIQQASLKQNISTCFHILMTNMPLPCKWQWTPYLSFRFFSSFVRTVFTFAGTKLGFSDIYTFSSSCNQPDMHLYQNILFNWFNCVLTCQHLYLKSEVDDNLLGCNSVWSCWRLPKFWKNVQ